MGTILITTLIAFLSVILLLTSMLLFVKAKISPKGKLVIDYVIPEDRNSGISYDISEEESNSGSIFIIEIPVSLSIFMIALWIGAAPLHLGCLLYTSPSPRDATLSRMPSSA